MTKTEKLLEISKKQIELEGVEAAVIEELLNLDIQPERANYQQDGGLASMILPLVNEQGESVVIAARQFDQSRIVQTVFDESGPKVSVVDLKNSHMDKICALWLRYRIAMIEKEMTK